LNTGRPSEEFELQFDRKIRMVDLAKQKHVVLPKEEMPTQNVVAQADVERALKEADDQQIDLLAQRPAAQPRDWLSWLGVAFGVLGLSALAVVLYLRRG
jgi:hypothetical protein